MRQTKDNPAGFEQQSSGTGGLLAGTSEDAPVRAAVLMVGSLTLLGLQDALVKLVSSQVTLWQFQMLRGSTVLVLLLCLNLYLGARVDARPRRLWTVALRSTFLCGAMVFFFGGAPFLPLSQMAAGLYMFPLFASLLAWAVLGDKVGPRRALAILAGFAGTLLIIKPWNNQFSIYSLLPIIAAFCYACAILTTRKLCREESPLTLAFAVNIAYVLVGLVGASSMAAWSTQAMQLESPYLFSSWIDLVPMAVGLIFVTAVLNMIANLGLAKAYQSGEPSWLAPFDYSYLIFTTFWGFVIFGAVPDLSAGIGMFMIAGAGIFVAWRERQDSRKRRADSHRALR